MVTKLRKNELIHSILLKTTTMDQILNRIKELSKNKDYIEIDKVVNKKIVNEILYLGYDISHKGTQYLIKTIEYIFENSCVNNSLEKEIYPKISLIYNESIHNIKVNINRATNAMYYNCEIEKLKRYFSFNYDLKPKTKVIINSIINHID